MPPSWNASTPPGEEGKQVLTTQQVGEKARGELAERGLLLLSWRRHTVQSSAPGGVDRRAELPGWPRAALRDSPSGARPAAARFAERLGTNCWRRRHRDQGRKEIAGRRRRARQFDARLMSTTSTGLQPLDVDTSSYN
jgi:hypothetical protein